MDVHLYTFAIGSFVIRTQVSTTHPSKAMQRSDKRQPYHNRRIQDMVLSERPQERLEKHGAQALSDRELLALILRSGQKGVDIISLTGELLDQAGSLAKLMYWTRADFLQVHGIGAVKAAQLLTVMAEITRDLGKTVRNGSNQIGEQTRRRL